jgi:hypothetical protein
LLIVYGYTYKWSFIKFFGPTLNYAQCFGLFAALTAAMFLLAYCWHRLKGWNIRYAKIVQFATIAGIVLSFLLREQ